jgi:hypothetical protein
VLDIAVATRGNSRLELCSLPPLSINLKRKQVASTLFAGQNKLKIVTQCRKSADYRQLDTTIAVFNDSRAAIEGFFGGGPDGSSPNKAALRYLRDFYEIVNDPKKRKKPIVDVCQRTAD